MCVDVIIRWGTALILWIDHCFRWQKLALYRFTTESPVFQGAAVLWQFRNPSSPRVNEAFGDLLECPILLGTQWGTYTDYYIIRVLAFIYSFRWIEGETETETHKQRDRQSQRYRHRQTKRSCWTLLCLNECMLGNCWQFDPFSDRQGDRQTDR